MHKCGALLVANSSKQHLLRALAAATKVVREVLYVPLVSHELLSAEQEKSAAATADLATRIDQLYLHVSRCSPRLDLRVLLPNGPASTLRISRFRFHSSKAQDRCLTEPGCLVQRRERDAGVRVSKPTHSGSLELRSKFVTIPVGDGDFAVAARESDSDQVRQFSDVALGGTFDCIHNGHRLLLARSALAAKSRILAGNRRRAPAGGKSPPGVDPARE